MADQRIGPTSNADGTTITNGQDRTAVDGSKVVTVIHGRRYEQASRGRVYSVMTGQAGVTLIAEMKQAPAATKKTVLSLVNPIGSNVNLEVLLAWLLHVSGTPAAGAWTWAVAPLTTPITQATTITPVSGKIISAPASKGIGYSNVALTAGPAHSLWRLMPAGLFADVLAATTPGQIQKDEVDAALVMPPGSILSIAPPDIGTAHIVCAAIEYAEVDLPG